MRRYCTGWACIGLLLATAAAQEQYDDRQTLDYEPVFYQDDNVLDMGSAATHKLPGKVLPKDILLYNFIRSLKHEEPPNRLKYRPDWFPSPDYEEAVQHQKDHRYEDSSVMFEKDGVVKRLAEAFRGSGTGRGLKRLERHGHFNAPQPKHKKGYRMVCYFKLCAFRPSV